MNTVNIPLFNNINSIKIAVKELERGTSPLWLPLIDTIYILLTLKPKLKKLF